MDRLIRLGMMIGLFALTTMAPLGADDHFVDYDADVNFAAFKSFTIGDGAMGSSAPELNNALTRKGVMDTIRGRLTAKGLVEAAGGGGDLLVTWSMGAEPRRGSRPLTPGRPRRVPITYTAGTLVIEITTRDSRLVWLGTYRDDESSPAKIAEQLPRNVAQLLKEYPAHK